MNHQSKLLTVIFLIAAVLSVEGCIIFTCVREGKAPTMGETIFAGLLLLLTPSIAKRVNDE
jgi:hypothetical protein